MTDTLAALAIAELGKLLEEGGRRMSTNTKCCEHCHGSGLVNRRRCERCGAWWSAPMGWHVTEPCTCGGVAYQASEKCQCQLAPSRTTEEERKQ